MTARVRTVTVPAERPSEGPIRVQMQAPDVNGVIWVEISTDPAKDEIVELLVTPVEARRLAQALLTVAGEGE